MLTGTRPRVRRVVLALLFITVAIFLSGCAATSDGSRVVMGGSEVLSSGEVLSGDLAVLGGNMVIEEGAEVRGDVALFGGDLTIEGEVEGDVAVFGGSVRYVPDAIDGEIAVVGGSSRPLMAADASEALEDDAPAEVPAPPVIDDIPFEEDFPPRVVAPSFTDRMFGVVGTIVGTLLRTIAFGVLGLVMALFLPDHVRRVGRAAGDAPAASAAVGCLAMPAAVMVVVVAAITVIGIPIAILVPFVVAAAAIFGWVGLGYFLGDRLLRSADVRSPRPAAATAIGAGGLVLASSVAGIIPLIGWLLGPFLAMWGLGATILTRGGRHAYPARPRFDAPVPPLTLDPLDDIPSVPRRPAKRSSNLFADLASDLGIEDEVLGAGDKKQDDKDTPNEKA